MLSQAAQGLLQLSPANLSGGPTSSATCLSSASLCGKEFFTDPHLEFLLFIPAAPCASPRHLPEKPGFVFPASSFLLDSRWLHESPPLLSVLISAEAALICFAVSDVMLCFSSGRKAALATHQCYTEPRLFQLLVLS